MVLTGQYYHHDDMRTVKPFAIGLIILLLAGGLGWAIVNRMLAPAIGPHKDDGVRVVPVEVAAVRQGAIEDRRTFSGTLEPLAQFVVAPKVAGRVERLAVQLGDVVTKGQVVAELDDEEFVQEVAQAEAELAVAQANLVEARSTQQIAERAYSRIQTLRERGVASESQLDVVEADRQARQAATEVAQAQVRRAEAALETAKIRLSYTQVIASWPDGQEQRFVAQRFVDAGYTLAANAPLVTVVALNPLTAVVFVTEKDYGRLTIDQMATLTTDAFPREQFDACIVRLAPVFEQTSRQARVELAVRNDQLRLKPGMFVRATIVLEKAADATIVPVEALASRDGKPGLFVIDDGGDKVRWVAVDLGIRDGDHVQVRGEGVSGRVVTLGQQLLEDGAPVRIADERKASVGSGEPGRAVEARTP